MDCQLWMGGLEPYMNETFISTAFKNTGANPVNVRVMPNKLTGESAGYSFVQFATDKEAIDALHKLNGTPIFGTNPVVRFHLNNANNLVDREFSVWVGDLSSDVDNYNLYKIFSSKYNTVKAAKVILDNGGFSKGYGFVTFGTEQEMKDALVNMDGFVGLGSNTLRVCSTIPKPKRAITTGNRGTDKYTPSTASTDYSYDEAYWQSSKRYKSEIDDSEEEIPEMFIDEGPLVINKNQDKRRRIEIERNKMLKAYDLRTSSVESPPMDDESSAFGQFIANKLRTYSVKTRSIVQHEISNVLFQADNGDYDFRRNFNIDYP